MRTINKTILILLVSAAACNQEPQKTSPTPTTAPPAPAPAAAAAPAADAAPAKPKLPPAQNDGLSLADRIAKRQAEENKLAAELAVQEKERTSAYDKQRLPLELAIFDFVLKTRADIDKLAEKGKGKPETKTALEELRIKNEKAIAAQQKKRETIDPKGGNSLASTDLDVMLYLLGHEYVDDLEGWLQGDEDGIKKQRAEMDKRSDRLKSYFAELKSAKPAKGGKK